MKTNKIKAMYNCVGDGCYPDGLLYKDGKTVATNGYMVCVLKSDYDPQNEGKIITKDGNLCDQRFPRWQDVIPNDYREYQIDIDSQRLSKAAKNIKSITGLVYGRNIGALIEMNGYVFSSKFIFDTLSIDSNVRLYITENARIIGENEDYFFIIAGEKMDNDKVRSKNEECLKNNLVKKIFTVDEALNYKQPEKVNFFDIDEIYTGKKIDEFYIENNKIDIVYHDYYLFAIYNQVSQACVHYNSSIEELKKIIKMDEFKKIDFTIPQNLTKKFFIIRKKDESTYTEKNEGRLVNVVKFDDEKLEVIKYDGMYYWCIDGYSFCSQHHLDTKEIIGKLNKQKYTAEDIKSFIKKHLENK